MLLWPQSCKEFKLLGVLIDIRITWSEARYHVPGQMRQSCMACAAWASRQGWTRPHWIISFTWHPGSPASRGKTAFPVSTSSRGSSATSVELVGAPGSSLSSSNQRYTKALPSRKARRHAFYGYQHGRTDPNRGYPSPRCVAPEPHLQRWWSIPHWMIPWQTTHCTEHPIPSQAGGLGVHKTTIYIYTYIRTYVQYCKLCRLLTVYSFTRTF